MTWDENLTGAHYNIAAWPGSPLRVVAGPGTGKTFALMRRVSRLLEAGVQPSSILAVTFTRTAATDLVAGLTNLGTPAADVEARTLHSLCFSSLSQAAVFEFTGRVARPLLDHERASMISDLAPQFDGKKQVKRLLHAFEAAWARLQHEAPGWPADAVDRAFEAALLAWLRYHRAMLIGELIPITLQYLRNNPAAPNRPSFQHVLVDEYQDLNRADQELAEILVAPQGALTVIGDEDQSIYSFRHAHPAGIAEFSNAHTGTHDEALEDCRRCPTSIVALASRLISHNRRARPTHILPVASNPAGNIHVVQHDSLDAETLCLSAYVEWYLRTHADAVPGDILVLTNRRRIGYSIRDELNRVAVGRDLPWTARSFFTEDALDSDEARSGMCVLQLLVDIDDRAAFRAWLGLGSPDHRAPAYTRLRTLADAHGLTPHQALEQIATGALKLSHPKSLLERRQSLITLLQNAQALSIPDLVDFLFPSTSPDCAAARDLAQQAVPLCAAPGELLDELRTLITQPEIPQYSDPVVRVMSLHKSKGLTARCVLIAGAIAGVMPSLRDGLPPAEALAATEEQRRLFYVALTRTTETLVISGAVRMLDGQARQMNLPVHQRLGAMAIMQASPFIAELGPTLPATQTGAAWRAAQGF